jgi:hypothetical protein
LLSGRQGFGGRRYGIEAVFERRELRSRFGSTCEQLFVGLSAEAAFRLGDPLELVLDLLQPAGLRLERREEAA